MGLRDESAVDFHAFTARENGNLWLELTYLLLYFVSVGFTDVRRVGDDEVKLLTGVDREQIRFPKEYFPAQAQPSSIGSRHFQSVVRDIAGVDFRVRQFAGQCQG